MSEVLSIRDPENLREYPGMAKIREAVIHSYEEYSQARTGSSRARAASEINSYKRGGGYSHHIFDRFFKEHNLLPLEGRNLEVAAVILTNHYELSATCNFMAGRIFEYLRANYPEMDSYIIETPNKIQTKYFLTHQGNVVHVEGHYYYLSISNIFNLDLKTPRLEGKPFDRLSGIIHSTNYDELIEKVTALEGGQWPSLEELILRNYAL